MAHMVHGRSGFGNVLAALGTLHILWGCFLAGAFFYYDLWNNYEGQILLGRLGFSGEGLAFLKVLAWSLLAFLLGSLSIMARFGIVKGRRWASPLGLLLVAIITVEVWFWKYPA